MKPEMIVKFDKDIRIVLMIAIGSKNLIWGFHLIQNHFTSFKGQEHKLHANFICMHSCSACTVKRKRSKITKLHITQNLI